MLVKIDPDSGATVWAKILTFSTPNSQLNLVKIKILNNTVWTIHVSSSKGFYNGVVLLVDSDGNTVK